MRYQGPPAFCAAVAELAKLPGIGEKTAQRLVFHMIHEKGDPLTRLADSLRGLREKIRICSVCCGLTEEDPCPICQDPVRDTALICVVEDPSDLFAIERSHQFAGRYHVLHGRLSPLDGVGPDNLTVGKLVRRTEGGAVREVILATNPDVEGEATALYIVKLLGAKGIKSTRIAMGIPMGGHLEYADQVTLGRAIAERRDFRPA